MFENVQWNSIRSGLGINEVLKLLLNTKSRLKAIIPNNFTVFLIQGLF